MEEILNEFRRIGLNIKLKIIVNEENILNYE